MPSNLIHARSPYHSRLDPSDPHLCPSYRPPSSEDLTKGLEKSLQILEHRGPDSRGIYVSPDARVGLGHVRLSVIDLSTGQQPLSDADDTIHCVVTGEIYDHERLRAEMEEQGYSFKSKTDSELVVQMYKRDGFNLLFNLRGEFAFVLYDRKRRLLFVARDRFGIKPLYYTVSNGRVLFASEIKAFMGLGWQARWDIESIVQLGDERTLLHGVQKLAPGYFAICRASGYVKTQAYWDLSYSPAATPVPGTLDSMVSNVRDLVVESVRLRLRSDVPLAVYLSGGIDSSAVAGIATQLLREKNPDAQLATFTLVYTENDTTDEAPIAVRTADHLGAKIHKVQASEAELVGALEESIWHSEQMNTSFHGAGRILLSRAVRRAGYKVVLSGEGADEIFGGYGWFPPDYFRDPDPAATGLGLRLPTDAERHEFTAKLQAKPGMPQWSSLPMSLHKVDRPLINIRSHLITSARGSAYLNEIFRPEVLDIVGSPNLARCIEEGIDARVRQHSVSGNWHSLNVSLYVTAKTVLEVILNQMGDRSDMANSIESRVPFLDHKLAEYVSTLPPSLKIMPIAENEPGKWRLVEKWILREAVKPFVTEELYLRKKLPFNPPPASRPAPERELLPLQAHLKARITQTNVERLGFINWPFIREMLSDYLETPRFPPQGAMDERAQILIRILSYIVLQERFHIPTWQP
ncbi:Asparagine synthetase domain-containing protein [Mycena sanguinolenta]|uniref:Asparagine synthetase domain-containing protein n=1 Tax=Mycena sanguinolenta TaxID=230812 RepID=A0A8H7D181_9AGAR|nr:Asparagine synthetase domain-containing protein [Mycena sanguinolenta]